MINQFFIIFVFLILSPKLVVSDCMADDVTNVESCYESYMKALNVNPITFLNYQNRIAEYLKDWNGFNNFCRIFDPFQNCIKNFMGCMNPTDFAKVPIVGTDRPGSYSGNFYSYRYTCNAGFQDYYYFLRCRNRSNVTNACPGYSGSCDGEKSHIKCFADYCTANCDAQSSTFVNTSMYLDLCNNEVECCKAAGATTTPSPNGSQKIGFEITGLVLLIGFFKFMN